MDRLILPGFRTDIFWKKVVASIYYFSVVVFVLILFIGNIMDDNGIFTNYDKATDFVSGMLLIVLIEIFLFAPAITLFFQNLATEKLKCNKVIYYLIVTPIVICILVFIVSIAYCIVDEVGQTYLYSEQHKAYTVQQQAQLKETLAQNNTEDERQETDKSENRLTDETTSVEKKKDDIDNQKTERSTLKKEVSTSEKYISGLKIGDFKNALKDANISGWKDFVWIKQEDYFLTYASDVQNLPEGGAYMLQAEIYTLEDRKNADVYQVQYTISGVQVTDQILLNTINTIFTSLYGDKGKSIYQWAESNLQTIKNKGSASIQTYDGVTVEIQLQNSKMNFYEINFYKVKSIKDEPKTSSNPAI